MHTLKFYLGKLSPRDLLAFGHLATEWNARAIQSGRRDPFAEWLFFYIEGECKRRVVAVNGTMLEVAVIKVPTDWEAAEVMQALTKATALSYATITPTMTELIDEMVQALTRLSAQHLNEMGASL